MVCDNVACDKVVCVCERGCVVTKMCVKDGVCVCVSMVCDNVVCVCVKDGVCVCVCER